MDHTSADSPKNDNMNSLTTNPTSPLNNLNLLATNPTTQFVGLAQDNSDSSESSSLRNTESLQPPACFLLNTFGSKKAKKLLPSDFQPGENTVLVGRSRECQEHSGNQRLRAIVSTHLQRYSAAPDKFQKTEIVTEVYNAIQADNPLCGAFVKREKGRYYEVGERTARERIGALFRDSLNPRRTSKSKVAAKKVEQGNEEECNTKKAPPVQQGHAETPPVQHEPASLADAAEANLLEECKESNEPLEREDFSSFEW